MIPFARAAATMANLQWFESSQSHVKQITTRQAGFCRAAQSKRKRVRVPSVLLLLRNKSTLTRWSAKSSCQLVVFMTSLLIIARGMTTSAQTIVDTGSRELLGRHIDTATGSSTDTGSNVNDNYDDSCAKRYQRLIDQLRKEIGYCNAVKMAVETRESVVKQQLTDVQHQLQLPEHQQNEVAVVSAENKLLLQEVTLQRKQIHELEQLLAETTTNNERASAALQLSLTDALRRLTEFNQLETNALNYKERNEYLEMRLEEAFENERRIDEMSRQLDDAKMFRINTKQAQTTHDERIDELEQQRLQEADSYMMQLDDVQHLLAQAIIEKDRVVLECKERTEKQEQNAVETSLLCNDQLQNLRQQFNNATNEYYNHLTALQHMLDDEMERTKVLNGTLQTEHEERRQMEQLYDEKSIDLKDRLITFEQMWEEEMERAKSLTKTLHMEREQRQQQELQQQQQQLKVAGTPKTNSIYRQYNRQLQQINEQYHNRHVEDNEKIHLLQNELYALRYDTHTQNEMRRHQGMVEMLVALVVRPIISWLRDPLWTRILQPHVVAPMLCIWAQYYDVVVLYVNEYIPLWNQYMIRARESIQVWHRAMASTASSLHQHYVLPLRQRFIDSVEFYYPIVSGALSRSLALLQRSIDKAVVQASPYVVPVVERAHSDLHTISAVIYLQTNQVEIWIVDTLNNHGLDGAKYVRQFRSIPFQMMAGLSLLLYLIRRRRRRYVLPEL